MRIKGHSIIELTDVKTGKVERYEDDNMVTNALDYIIQDGGMLYSSPLKQQAIQQDAINQFFGGLLLFDDTITEDADNMVYEGGLTMVGNGAHGYTYNGEDGVTEFGSWNFTESKWTSDGKYRMVWDFTQEQANGTIACACLTSKSKGYAGVGNASEVTAGNHKSPASVELVGAAYAYNVDEISGNIHTRIFDVSETNSTITYVDYYNIWYNQAHSAEHMGTTGKIKLVTKKIPLSIIDIRETYPYMYQPSQLVEPSQQFIPVVTTEITLPSSFVNALGNASPWGVGRYGDYYYMLAGSINVAPNTVIQGCRINCTTKVAEAFTVTNTTDFNWSTADYLISFGNNNIAFYTGGKVVFQNIFTNSTTKVVTQSLGEVSEHGAVMIREKSFVIGSESATGGQTAGFFVDMVNRTVTACNESYRKRCGRYISSDNPFLYNVMGYDGGYWQDWYFKLGVNADYLATINNLATPVVKSAEKTMKVIYILSFDDGD